MAREKVDNKLNVVIGTKAQVEADNTIPDNSIIVVTDEELTASDITQDANNRFVTDTEKSTWNNKVDKEAGKGLTKNELTDDLKGKYDTAYSHSQSTHAPSNAQVNVIETVKVNGVALPVSSKAVDITIPETDLSNYYNKPQTEALINNAILGLLGGES